MNSTLTALVVFACLVGAIFVGRTLRRLLPEDHLSAESKDAVKLAMGLVATMSALVLGLLVSSAKGSYDTERSEVIQMASKVTFLARRWTLTDRKLPVSARSFARRWTKGFGKCGREKYAGRHAWLRIRKQPMPRTVPFRLFRRKTICRRHSRRRQRPWP